MKVYSFDVFDTCVVRCYPRPTDLFYPLASAMLTQTRGKEAFAEAEVYELVRERIAAEREAQRTKTRGDVTLADIYRAFSSLGVWGIDPQAMQEEEVALELRAVRPISSIKRRIETLRERGARVIYISDMYLPHAVIWQMLVDQGIAQEGETLYVSGDLGVTKRSGKLFDHVLKTEGLKPGELEHIGDNVYGDFFAARKRGVKAEHFTASHPNRLEDALLRAAPNAPHDAALVAGLSRATRLSAPMSAAAEGGKDRSADDRSSLDGAVRDSVTALGANVLAPLLSGFALWILENARARGLERLYFTEGNDLMLKVTQALAPAGAPELRYLHGSEDAWRLASLTEHDILRLQGDPAGTPQHHAELDLMPDLVTPSTPASGSGEAHHVHEQNVGLPGSSNVSTPQRVLEDPKASQQVLERAQKAREDALAYFRQEGLLDDRAWAVVDTGWTLETQRSLKKILEAGGQNYVFGYYLGLSKTRVRAPESGPSRAFFLEEAETAPGGGSAPFFENKRLLDHLLKAAGHTQGYRCEAGRVLPYPAGQEQVRTEALNSPEETVVAFARELTQSDLMITDGYDEDSATENAFREDVFKGAARAAVNLLLSKPTRREARAVAALLDTTAHDIRLPLHPLRTGTLYRFARDAGGLLRSRSRRRALAKLKALRESFPWLEGSVALSGPWARSLLWAAREARGLRKARKGWAVRAARVMQGRR